MLRAKALVFDDIISVSGPGSALYYTSADFDEFLAQGDQIAIQAIADNLSGGKISVWIETSADGRHWATKNAAPEVAPYPPSSTPTQVILFPYGGDGGGLPSGGFVRLRITFAETATAVRTAHLRVFVALRDAGRAEPPNRAFGNTDLTMKEMVRLCQEGKLPEIAFGRHTKSWCEAFLLCKGYAYQSHSPTGLQRLGIGSAYSLDADPTEISPWANCREYADRAVGK
jgi:hypothetical protein